MRLSALLISLTVSSIFAQGCAANTGSPIPPDQVAHDTIPAASTQQWITQFGTGTIVYPGGNSYQWPGDLMSAIVAAPDGGVYATGYTLGAFPGFPGNPNHVAEPYLARFSPVGKQLWVQQFASGSGDFIFDAQIDSSGNVYLCGSTLGAFPGYNNESGSKQALIVKVDSAGKQSWIRQFSVANQITSIHAAAADSSSHLFVTGELKPSASSSYQNFFVAAIDTSSGSLLWEKEFGINATDIVYAATADSNGGLYLSGVSSGPFPGMESKDYQAFIVKLATSDGHQVWIQTLSDITKSTHLYLPSLAVSPDGNIILGGAQSNDVMAVGQMALAGASALLLKVSSESGTIMWKHQYSTGDGDQISAVGVLANGNIVAVGSTNGLFSNKFSRPADNLFVIKADTLGNPLWAQQFGTGDILNVSTIQFGAHLAVNSSNDLLIGGATQGAYPGASNPFSAVEGFVAKFGP